MYQTLVNLEVGAFTIRFNNRKILNGLPEVANFSSEKAGDVFRILDKIDKIGLENVVVELQRKPENDFDKSALALSDFSIKKIKEFLGLSGKNQLLLTNTKTFFAGVAIAEEGITECEKIMLNLSEAGISEEFWQFDLSIARGLGYYTGPVFETMLKELPEIGSVFSGGRYDDLVARYTGEKMPAVGASVGVDRLIAALEKLGKIKKRKSTAKVLITLLDEKFSAKMIKLATDLRKKKINAEVYLGKGLLKEQIIYAAKREIPFLIIFGEEEESAGKFRLKNMNERTEEVLTEPDLIDKLSV
jgi:histidyl-tRNA synthetase